MPQGDGTGPRCQGSRTGRGLGPCNPKAVPASTGNRSGMGSGQGMGRGQGTGRGQGRGRGQGGGRSGRWGRNQSY